MPLFSSSRKKSVTFRLSTEEYEALRSYCIGRKIRSISELARESILQQVYAEHCSNRTLVSGDMDAFASAVEETVVALKKLGGKISTVYSPSQ
jgi:cysteine sulfinate desulfinase/cysteine desulfurase-like protein